MTHQFKVGDRIKYKDDNEDGTVVHVVKHGNIKVKWDNTDDGTSSENPADCIPLPDELALDPAYAALPVPPGWREVRVGTVKPGEWCIRGSGAAAQYFLDVESRGVARVIERIEVPEPRPFQVEDKVRLKEPRNPTLACREACEMFGKELEVWDMVLGDEKPIVRAVGTKSPTFWFLSRDLELIPAEAGEGSSSAPCTDQVGAIVSNKSVPSPADAHDAGCPHVRHWDWKALSLPCTCTAGTHTLSEDESASRAECVCPPGGKVSWCERCGWPEGSPEMDGGYSHEVGSGWPTPSLSRIEEGLAALRDSRELAESYWKAWGARNKPDRPRWRNQW